MSIKIPEVLQPKMKGSTVLAKNLRAFEKLLPHPTEHAEKARQQAQNLLDKRLGRDITVERRRGMQINPVMTLNKRREALKRLAKNPETTVKEFHALLGDATEDETCCAG